jgi:hypothetical protein
VLKTSGNVVRSPFENAGRIGYVIVCTPTRIEAENVADALLVQHRFCKFVAAGLRGCVGRSDEGA